ncbi:hypothetical protein HON52_00725 [Candidatus Uhrbacteria bacterium]|jgi:hypothetical protein|nr:hypothetical protein [Candidatus Uhrbacteria bacterium]
MVERKGQVFNPEKRDISPKKNHRLEAALVVSAVLHLGGIFHERIADEVQDLPRTARSIANSQESDAALQTLLSEMAPSIESGEVLDIDLSDLYFQQEELVGGVSEETIAQAKQRYEEILAEAGSRIENGDDVNGVITYILQEQGEYEEDESFMSDLLVSGEGNCEAREKFISAAIQDVYPDLVSSGDVKLQLFGAYVDDETGEPRPGHVRVVLDQHDGTIAILEGGKITFAPEDEQSNIPTYEVTQLAVKSLLAKEGLYSFENQQVSSDEGITDSVSMDKSNELTFSDSLTLMGSNSISAFPKSDAVYGVGVYSGGSSNPLVVSERGQSGGEHKLEHMELTLLKEMDINNPRSINEISASTYRSEYPLYNYTNVTEEAIHNAVLDVADYRSESDKTYLTYIQLSGDQVPLQEDIDTVLEPDGIYFEIMESIDIVAWKDREVPTLSFRNLLDFPDDLDMLAWKEGAEIDLYFRPDIYLSDADDTAILVKPSIFNADVDKVSFAMENSERKNKNRFARLVFNPKEIINGSVKSFSFDHILPQDLAGVSLDNVQLSGPEKAFSDSYFYKTDIEALSISLDKKSRSSNGLKNQKKVGEGILSKEIWGPATPDTVGKTNTTIGTFHLNADAINTNAFARSEIKTADLVRVGRFSEAALNGAKIENLRLSAHSEGLEDALGAQGSSDDTDIGSVKIEFSVQATFTEEHYDRLLKLSKDFEKIGTGVTFVLQGQGVQGKEVGIEYLKKVYSSFN